MAAVVKRRKQYHLVAWLIVVLVAVYFFTPVISATEFSLAETLTESGQQTYGLDA